MQSGELVSRYYEDGSKRGTSVCAKRCTKIKSRRYKIRCAIGAASQARSRNFKATCRTDFNSWTALKCPAACLNLQIRSFGLLPDTACFPLKMLFRPEYTSDGALLHSVRRLRLKQLLISAFVSAGTISNYSKY